MIVKFWSLQGETMERQVRIEIRYGSIFASHVQDFDVDNRAFWVVLDDGSALAAVLDRFERVERDRMKKPGECGGGS